MFRRIIQSFLLAFQNIRANFFHTFLSVLGIVIGVGALVSILSLIDGMEEYAREEIATTTSLNSMSVNSDHYIRKDGITIRKDSVTFLTYDNYQEIKSSLTYPATCYIFQRLAKEVTVQGDSAKTAAYVTGVAGLKPDSVLAGRAFTADDFSSQAQSATLTEALAKAVMKNGKMNDLIGKEIRFSNRKLKVVGIVYLRQSQGPELFFPFTLLTKADLKGNAPQLVVEAKSVEDVTGLKKEINSYLAQHFGEAHDFKVNTNDFRLEQAEKGFFLFRVIMGLIVGISVVVGGIGVMNVLLISVTERTAEIGIRKAVGANRRDIVLLFLSESITVSAFGSFFGLIFGMLFTMAVIPIVKALTKIPFQAAYTGNTLLIIAVLAVIVGIIFGTYPALRASRLNPVDAIRHE
ncbi:MAG: ABC transporter permease [Cyclobacteriaceae bacterium]|nr:ABC transporter permease [Cyclobacteriaceae bacterium]